jgi:LMBR1 domain-containing protein 1
MLLLPLDVFVVSFNVDPATGFQRDPSLTATDANGVLILYYVLYATIGVLGFVLLPFAFFFFEEADDDTTTAQRCCSAIKYTIIFVLVLVVLLVIGAFVKHTGDAPSSGTAWINNLARDTAQQKQMALCV